MLIKVKTELNRIHLEQYLQTDGTIGIIKDQNMVLNLLRYHHLDKKIYELVTVYSQQYKLDEVRWGPRKHFALFKRIFVRQFVRTAVTSIQWGGFSQSLDSSRLSCSSSLDFAARCLSSSRGRVFGPILYLLHKFQLPSQKHLIVYISNICQSVLTRDVDVLESWSGPYDQYFMLTPVIEP